MSIFMDIYESFISTFSSVHTGKDQYEHEEADVEEHMTGHRDRPHSRDNAGVGLPATWNRRKRIRQNDSDSPMPVEDDKDLSLNYKSSAGKKKSDKQRKNPGGSNASSRVSNLEKRLGKISPKFSEAFQKIDAEKLYSLAKSDPSKCLFILNENEKSINEAASRYHELFSTGKNLPDVISEAWGKANNVYIRAGMVEALRKAAMGVKLPDSIKVPIMNSRGSRIGDLSSIKAILKPREKVSKLPQADVEKLVSLATAYKSLSFNPTSISPNQVKDEKSYKIILKQVQALSDLAAITSAWHGVLSQFKSDESGNIDISEGNWDAVLGKIDSFLHRSSTPLVDSDKYFSEIAEQMREKYGNIPPEMEAVLEGYGAKIGKKNSDQPGRSDEYEGEEFSDKQKEKSHWDKAVEEAEKDFSDKKPSWLTRAYEDEVVEGARKELSDKQKERERRKEEQAKKSKKNSPVKQNEHQTGQHDKNVGEARKGPGGEEKPDNRAEDNALVAAGGDSDQGATEFPSAASNKTVCRRMINKSATYHGVVCQGHPTDPAGSSPKTYDKRYFGKKHYDSILACAKDFLKQDWLKYGWGETPGDVPTRAALDLAIHTADDGLYQSKIDSMTYNMLLNKLAGWDFDVFNETLFAKSETRKASVMVRNSSAQEILKIADSLRSAHPDLSIQIIKNVHAIMRAAAESQDQGQAFRQREEKDLESKLTSVLEEFGMPKGPELSRLINDVLAEIDKIDKPKSGEKVSSVSRARVFQAFIRVAFEKPEYRKHVPVVLAAIKKDKSKADKAKADKAKADKAKADKAKADKAKADKAKSEKAKADKAKVDKAKADKAKSEKPSAKEKKSDKSDKSDKSKKTTSKKRKAGVVLASSDINW
jgi:hypothetical protein